MEPGTSIGGIVRDEAGQPIEGVNVNLYENRPDDGARQAYDFGAISAHPIGRDAGRSILSRMVSTSDVCTSRSHIRNS